MAHLFEPFTIKSITLRNRIGVSPMCMYSSDDGVANDWHLVHLGARAAGGAGLVIAEATAVAPEGRITPGDAGIWSDQQVEPIARINRFIKAQGVDLIDCSSGGSSATARIPVGAGFQVPFAERIRREANIATAAVGMITEPRQADQIIRTGQADVVLLAREFLRDPNWPLRAATVLHAKPPPAPPRQYARAW